MASSSSASYRTSSNHSVEKINVQCRFYGLGACRFGDNCRYLHTEGVFNVYVPLLPFVTLTDLKSCFFLSFQAIQAHLSAMQHQPQPQQQTSSTQKLPSLCLVPSNKNSTPKLIRNHMQMLWTLIDWQNNQLIGFLLIIHQLFVPFFIVAMKTAGIHMAKCVNYAGSSALIHSTVNREKNTTPNASPHMKKKWS